jgi:hypothetical protein
MVLPPFGCKLNVFKYIISPDRGYVNEILNAFKIVYLSEKGVKKSVVFCYGRAHPVGLARLD